MVATASMDRTVHVWDVASLAAIQRRFRM
ncbi:hypothetical protein [Roseiflexus sp.]